PLTNRPESVIGHWLTQFSSMPDLVDFDRDGNNDWHFGDAPGDTVANGIWTCTAGNELHLSSVPTMTTLTTIEWRCRHLASSGDGAILNVDADWANGEFADLKVRVVHQADNWQSVLLTAHDGVSESVLSKLEGLPDEFLDLRLVVDPQSDVAMLFVNGYSLGGVTYPTRSQVQSTPTLFITNNGADAEFDMLSVTISEALP
ncbi:MAG: hypothetical protein KDB27_13525, partial [Planctomycetales bacterium]|nr:hypothetical protein [Planctomycetales bacterium]